MGGKQVEELPALGHHAAEHHGLLDEMTATRQTIVALGLVCELSHFCPRFARGTVRACISGPGNIPCEADLAGRVG
jgi:hypothetical protein